VVSRHKIVAEFMGQEDTHKGNRKRKALGKGAKRF